MRTRNNLSDGLGASAPGNTDKHILGAQRAQLAVQQILGVYIPG